MATAILNDERIDGADIESGIWIGSDAVLTRDRGAIYEWVVSDSDGNVIDVFRTLEQAERFAWTLTNAAVEAPAEPPMVVIDTIDAAYECGYSAGSTLEMNVAPSVMLSARERGAWESGLMAGRASAMRAAEMHDHDFGPEANPEGNDHRGAFVGHDFASPCWASEGH